MLNELLKNPATTAEAVHAELDRLSKNLEGETLYSFLNRGDGANRPINLAVRYASPEVLGLLLSCDCQITDETRHFLDDRAHDLPKVVALLDFYGFLQSQARGLSEFFPLGETLKLVDETMTHLTPYLCAPLAARKPAIVFMGETKVGKSSLCNTLYGAEYELVKVKRRKTLVLRNPLQGVKVKVSDLFRSETSYPQILSEPHDPFCVVDMPGHNDSRGIAQEISIGLGAAGLSDCFNQLQALVLVCLGHDSIKLGAEFQKTLKLAAKIIGGSESCLRNLMLIVNQVEEDIPAEEIISDFKKLLRQNPNFSEEVKFLLENLKEDQIIVVPDVPGEAFRQSFFTRVQAMQASEFKQFDLNEYNSNFASFKWLLKELESYRQQVKMEGIAILNAKAKVLSRDMAKLQDGLKVSKGLPIKTAKDAGVLPQILPLQERIGDLIKVEESGVTLSQKFLECIQRLNESLSAEQAVEVNVTGDLSDASAEWNCKSDIVEGFFMKIDPLLQMLSDKPTLAERAAEAQREFQSAKQSADHATRIKDKDSALRAAGMFGKVREAYRSLLAEQALDPEIKQRMKQELDKDMEHGRPYSPTQISSRAN